MRLLVIAVSGGAALFFAGFLVAMIVGWLRTVALRELVKDLRRSNQELKNSLTTMESAVPRAKRTMWDD